MAETYDGKCDWWIMLERENLFLKLFIIQYDLITLDYELKVVHKIMKSWFLFQFIKINEIWWN